MLVTRTCTWGTVSLYIGPDYVPNEPSGHYWESNKYFESLVQYFWLFYNWGKREKTTGPCELYVNLWKL